MIKKNLSNLYFIVNDNILSDDIYDVFLSLLDEFDRITENGLIHNLELSQYYAINQGIKEINGKNECENCELVLRYNNNTVCITNGHIELIKKETVCNISRGLIRFYVKERINDVFKYTKVRVVRIDITNSLNQYENSVYQNNDELEKIEEANNKAVAEGQSNFNKSNENEHNINSIINETKKASTNSQLQKMNENRIISSTPTQSSVDTAHTFSSSLKNNDVDVFLVPGNEPLNIKENEPIKGIIKSSGIKPKQKEINNSASIMIECRMAIIPKMKGGNDLKTDTTNVIKDIDKSLHSDYIKFKDLTSSSIQKTKQILDTTENKLSKIYKKNIIPYTSKLNIMTTNKNLPQYNIKKIIPQNTSERFEQKLNDFLNKPLFKQNKTSEKLSSLSQNKTSEISPNLNKSLSQNKTSDKIPFSPNLNMIY